jgi:hypothetical protein
MKGSGFVSGKLAPRKLRVVDHAVTARVEQQVAEWVFA